MPIETFNILFENTQNKQQYGTNITCIEVRLKKKVSSYFKNVYNFLSFQSMVEKI